MNRDQIMDTTYEAILRLTRLKAKYGLISEKTAETQQWRIKTAIELEKRIGEIWNVDNYREELKLLKPQVDKINAMRANERDELELPVSFGKLRYLSSLWSILSKRS